MNDKDLKMLFSSDDDDFMDIELPATAGDDDPVPRDPKETVNNPSFDELFDVEWFDDDAPVVPVSEPNVKKEEPKSPYAKPAPAKPAAAADNSAKRPCPYCTTPISEQDCIPFFMCNPADLKNFIGDDLYTRSQEITKDTYRKYIYGPNADRTKDPEIPQGLFLFSEIQLELTGSVRYDRATRCLKGPDGSQPLQASATEACPHCGQFIPKAYWTHDCVGIALYGSAKVGKTAWMCSLLSNNCRQLCQGRKGFATRLLAGTDVGIHDVLEEALSDWAAGVMPRATNDRLPPVFIEITWPAEKPNAKPRKQLLYIIDQSGEDAVNRESTTSVIMRQCDGILYLIDPEQFPEWRNNASASESEETRMPDDDSDAVVPDSEMSDSANTDKSSRSGPLDVYNKLVGVESINQKSCAVIITKIDRLFNANNSISISREKLDSIPYSETISPAVDHTPAKGVIYNFDEEPFYNEAVEKVFSLTKYPLGDISALCPDATRYFVCSALGCEPAKEYRSGTEKLCFHDLNPIHVSDPVIWLLREKMRKAEAKKN